MTGTVLNRGGFEPPRAKPMRILFVERRSLELESHAITTFWESVDVQLLGCWLVVLPRPSILVVWRNLCLRNIYSSQQFVGGHLCYMMLFMLSRCLLWLTIERRSIEGASSMLPTENLRKIDLSLPLGVRNVRTIDQSVWKSDRNRDLCWLITEGDEIPIVGWSESLVDHVVQLTTKTSGGDERTFTAYNVNHEYIWRWHYCCNPLDRSLGIGRRYDETG
jgi:hypothetical protein